MKSLIRSLMAIGFLSLTSITIFSQENSSIASKLEQERESNLSVGAYGQLDYTQRVASSTSYAGKLDPHRVVLFLGYQFSPKIHLVSEFEVEHGNEFYLEQAYLNFSLNNKFQLRGGVMLIPMGLINEYHEPTRFNGVQRPSVDNIIVPTTWREMGAGVRGRLDNLSLTYQAYIFTGFNGYDTQDRITAKDGFRKARQKAINSYITSPNLSAKVSFNGITNLKVGLAGYFGRSQSKLFDKLNRNNDLATSRADSSVVNISMIGIDAQYRYKAFEVRGEYIHTFLGNTNKYNSFNGQKNDIGSQMQGWYLELAYDLLQNKYYGKQKLTPFVRYEDYNTQHKLASNVESDIYHFSEITAGLGYSPTHGVVVKADYQWKYNHSNSNLNENWINCGIGFAF